MPGTTAVVMPCIGAVSPALRVVADYPAFWQAGYFDYDFTLVDVLLGWLAVGYFPVFPWLAFPLLGHALAAWLFGEEVDEQVDVRGESRSGRVAASGIAGIATAFALTVSWPALPAAITGEAALGWTMFPASTAYCLGTLGTVTLAAATTTPRKSQSTRGRERSGRSRRNEYFTVAVGPM